MQGTRLVLSPVLHPKATGEKRKNEMRKKNNNNPKSLTKNSLLAKSEFWLKAKSGGSQWVNLVTKFFER